MTKAMKSIKIATGRYQGQTLNVVEDGKNTVRVSLLSGGTMILPKNSTTTGITYFSGVDNEKHA